MDGWMGGQAGRWMGIQMDTHIETCNINLGKSTWVVKGNRNWGSHLGKTRSEGVMFKTDLVRNTGFKMLYKNVTEMTNRRTEIIFKKVGEEIKSLYTKAKIFRESMSICLRVINEGMHTLCRLTVKFFCASTHKQPCNYSYIFKLSYKFFKK